MDPITQGIVGAAITQPAAQKRHLGSAALLGALAGMAPDLDVLIRSETDPLLALEYHRQFTHALAFIPVGAFICAGILYLLWSHRLLSFKHTYLYCLLGYATHGLLDACTTYGTLLFWPFSHARVAWNTVSVIDPLFSLPLLLLLIVTIILRSKRWAWAAVFYAAAYLLLGAAQNHRALDAARTLAAERGHMPLNLGVKPSFANIVVWKSVYEYDGRYYVDAIRAASAVTIIEGTTTEKLILDKHLPWLAVDSQQSRDVRRFRWFSNDHLGVDPADEERIIDIRYSLIPNQLTGMWGLKLSPMAVATQHAKFTTNRPEGEKMNESIRELWLMITGAIPSRPLNTVSQ
jgi:inner membrane protein